MPNWAVSLKKGVLSKNLLTEKPPREGGRMCLNTTGYFNSADAFFFFLVIFYIRSLA